MEWLIKIINNPVLPAHLALLFALVIWLGVKLGKLKLGGISLGVTFVLFVGILAGHLYHTFVVAPSNGEMATAMANQTLIINFIKEFGLVLFVYCIGLQVGPGFFATFKKGGVEMNLLSTALIVLNIAVMLALYFIWFYSPGDPLNKKNLAMMTGTLYGAVTNTPGLGAANNILPRLLGGSADYDPGFNIGSSYACAYPLAVVGIIGATIAIRYICKVSLDKEAKEYEHANEADPSSVPEHFILRVTNKAVVGHTLQELHNFVKGDFVCSRAKKDGEMFIPKENTVMEEGMKLYIVTATSDKEAIIALMGELIDEDWQKETEEEKRYISQRLIISKPEVNGMTFNDLHFSSLYNVNVTRVSRAGMTLFARRNFRLQMGDHIRVTGTEENINRVRAIVGDTQKRLEAPNVGMMFLGILLGIFLGQIPIPIPGISEPVKLGLAGGPLVLGILIGAFGYKFKITAYTTNSANLMLREVGLVLFLAGVGVQAGATFWNTVSNGGYHYVWMGFLITVIPIMICGLYGRLKMKLNYFTLMGLIAGTNTDPPALAFANQTANNDAPAVGYSTVYPLSMFLRILTAQLILLILIPLV